MDTLSIVLGGLYKKNTVGLTLPYYDDKLDKGYLVNHAKQSLCYMLDYLKDKGSFLTPKLFMEGYDLIKDPEIVDIKAVKIQGKLHVLHYNVDDLMEIRSYE